MRPQTRARRRGVTAGILVALLTLTGCGAVDDLIPVTTASDAGTASLGLGTDLFALAVGDCVNAVDGDLHSGVSLVPCADSHDWEIYFEAAVPGTGASGADYPGDEVLMAAAEANCGAQFGPYLGLDQAATTTDSAAGSTAGSPAESISELGYTYLTPSETDWTDQADHGVTCLIGNMSGPVAGSLAGAAG